MLSLKGREGTYEGILAPGNAPPGYFLIALARGKNSAWTTTALKMAVPNTSGTLGRAASRPKPAMSAPATANRAPETRVVTNVAISGLTLSPPIDKDGHRQSAGGLGQEVEAGNGGSELDHGGGDQPIDDRLSEGGAGERNGEGVCCDDELGLDAGHGQRVASGHVEDKACGKKDSEQDEGRDIDEAMRRGLGRDDACGGTRGPFENERWDVELLGCPFGGREG